MAYASSTGAENRSSSFMSTCGESGEEHDRMNRIGGICAGCGKESRIWCMVGVAVYQLALYVAKSAQNVGARRGGTMTALPARSVDRKDAIRPCTWKRGIISIVRSAGCRE